MSDVSEQFAKDIINIDNALVDIQQRLERLEVNTESRLNTIEQTLRASEAFLEKILGGLSEFKNSPLVKMLGGNIGKGKSTNVAPSIPALHNVGTGTE